MARRILLVSSLLLLLALSAAGQPIVTLIPPQFDALAPVAEPATIPARKGQTHPTIASNGDGWLVAWSDTRYASTIDRVRSEDVFATIVDSAGTVLHPEGIPVAPTWASDRYPSAVWTGSSYLVVWTSEIGLFGAHLDARGRFLRSGLLGEAGPGTTMRETAIARSGDRLLLVWSESDWNWTNVIRWRFLDTEGRPVSEPANLAPPTIGPQRNPSVASFHDGFLVAWEEAAAPPSRVFAATVRPGQGAGPAHAVGSGPASPRPFGMWTAQASPSVASPDDRSEAMIVWTDGNVQARAFGLQGPAGSATVSVEGPAVAPWIIRFMGDYLVFWSAGEEGAIGADGFPAIGSLDLYAGILTGFPGVGRIEKIAAIPEAQVGVRAAWNAEAQDVFVAWTDSRLGSSTDHPFGARYAGDVFGSRLRAGFEGGALLARSPAEQRPLGIATAADGTFRAIWSEDLDDDEEGLLTRGFASDGTPTGDPRLIARGRNFAADIAAGDAGFAIAWSSGGVFATLLDRNGAPLGDPVSVDSGGSFPAIASDGRDFLVAWDAPMPPFEAQRFRRILVQVVRGEGALAGAPVAISAEPGDQPRAAWTGSRYLVVWSDTASSFAGRGTTGRFVGSSGAPLGAAPLVFASFMKYQSGPRSVASSGTEHLIGTSGRLIATDAEGTVVELRGPFLGPALSVAWTGATFAAAQVESGLSSIPGLWPVEIAPAGPASVVAIAAARTMPLPFAHPNTITRAVLAAASLGSDRRRLALRP